MDKLNKQLQELQGITRKRVCEVIEEMKNNIDKTNEKKEAEYKKQWPNGPSFLLSDNIRDVTLDILIEEVAKLKVRNREYS